MVFDEEQEERIILLSSNVSHNQQLQQQQQEYDNSNDVLNNETSLYETKEATRCVLNDDVGLKRKSTIGNPALTGIGISTSTIAYLKKDSESLSTTAAISHLMKDKYLVNNTVSTNGISDKPITVTTMTDEKQPTTTLTNTDILSSCESSASTAQSNDDNPTGIIPVPSTVDNGDQFNSSVGATRNIPASLPEADDMFQLPGSCIPSTPPPQKHQHSQHLHPQHKDNMVQSLSGYGSITTSQAKDEGKDKIFKSYDFTNPDISSSSTQHHDKKDEMLKSSGDSDTTIPSSPPSSTLSPPTSPNGFVLYKRRWVVLAVFSLISMSNEVIWISLSSITSVVKEYYGVSYIAVNWLSMIYMLFYLFVFLAALALDRKGLKFTIMIGAVLNGLGSCARLIGTNRDGFAMVFVGNALAALAQCFILFVPPSLAAIWFGENERATASAVGVLMNMLGVAIGFLMGGTMVPNSPDYEGVVRDGMFTTLLIQAVFCTIMVVLCLVLIHDAPQTPPSMSQKLILVQKRKKREEKQKGIQNNTSVDDGKYENNDNHIDCSSESGEVINFRTSLKLLIKDKNFHLVAQAYGIYFGLFGAYNTTLNQMCMNHFPGREQEIGLMGFTSVILGLIGILLAGVWLDKTKRYKSISVATFLACTTSLLAFTLILVYTDNFTLVYVSFSIFGFSSYPYMTVGLEHAAEITYPIPEGITSGILLLFGNMYAIVLTFICGAIIDKGYSDTAGFLMTGLYFIGVVVVAVVEGEMKRWQADKKLGKERNCNGGKDSKSIELKNCCK